MNTIHQDDHFCLARKSQALHLRAKFIQGIRHFFIQRHFLEVETPVRIPSPAPEEHIEAIPSGNWFLQTSPELCMKRLLAAGYPRIFQFCKCFRADERGSKHLPEFTMLEWYVAQFDYCQLMDQCETMLIAGLKDLGYDQRIIWQNKKIDFAPGWERITVADAFFRYAPMSCPEALAQDRFDEILVAYIEPHLGADHPTFLYDYPAKLAALAKAKKSDPTVAERFELYIGGMEIANGFSELTDADEQRRRFEEAQQARAKKNWARYAMPEKFLQALRTLPETAGIALGIDRMMMILTDTVQIDNITAFPPEAL
ncbi:MAG TPA: EF-P lysine aminoacylase EpmA [Smithellaceae bacterium]|nr:EF-P lysine aminoacylase EpmA [Smithellaceae bacterium]HPE07276.1 EF-P lysine aminoacylase EpmA [Smithellaceae bacterium]HRY37229.1 EF-P lysine aminoacylase EpmA [Smithellaceae bacterium]